MRPVTFNDGIGGFLLAFLIVMALLPVVLCLPLSVARPENVVAYLFIELGVWALTGVIAIVGRLGTPRIRLDPATGVMDSRGRRYPPEQVARVVFARGFRAGSSVRMRFADGRGTWISFDTVWRRHITAEQLHALWWLLHFVPVDPFEFRNPADDTRGRSRLLSRADSLRLLQAQVADLAAHGRWRYDSPLGHAINDRG
jgi:hypothetical protein